MTLLDQFTQSLRQGDLLENLRSGVIGDGIEIVTPQGVKPLLYADYVASGRALRQVERFVAEEVLPFYANSHTEASYCGQFITRLREEARADIARMLGASDAHVIFAGAGATAGLNKIVRLLAIPETLAAGQRVVVLHGPYEHHSNILPWRESGAEVMEIGEAETGGPDMAELQTQLAAARGALVVGSFSAVSNVTGIVTDTDAVTRMLKAHGALAVWDYAGGAPYVAMQMQTAPDAAKDAIVFSAHKFPGGPAASGVAVLRDSMVRRATPTQPGGGTVRYVSPWGHDYLARLVNREEAGTPNAIGDIRADLVLRIKEALGQDWIDRRHAELRTRALAVWSHNPAMQILGNAAADKLPIFAFLVRSGVGEVVSHQAFTRALSDHYGIQARGGCACAGPYGHRLLGVGKAQSEAIRAALAAGQMAEKPGWVRLNLSYLLTDEKADAIIQGVDALARRVDAVLGDAPASAELRAAPLLKIDRCDLQSGAAAGFPRSRVSAGTKAIPASADAHRPVVGRPPSLTRQRS